MIGSDVENFRKNRNNLTCVFLCFCTCAVTHRFVPSKCGTTSLHREMLSSDVLCRDYIIANSSLCDKKSENHVKR